MQFKVPQKIDIEDKIVGPLTMVQFVYAVLGAGAGYLLLNSLPSPLNWFFAVLVFGLTFFITFVKINGRPSTLFLKNLLVYIFNPRVRLWHKNQSNIRVEIYQPKEAKTADPYANKRYSRADIEKIANIIDTRGRYKTNSN